MVILLFDKCVLLADLYNTFLSALFHKPWNTFCHHHSSLSQKANFATLSTVEFMYWLQAFEIDRFLYA